VSDVGQSPKVPASAKVTIYEVAERPWGWLVTSAEVDDCVYIGSREWCRQLNSNSTHTNAGVPLRTRQKTMTLPASLGRVLINPIG
jgi:hypothetical protein